jgi:hypothetical protein
MAAREYEKSRRVSKAETLRYPLLHETSHLTDVIVPESGSMAQEGANNLEILKHCQKALGLK